MKYLFYRIYAWNLNTWGEGDAPEIKASVGVSFLILMNVYFLFGVLLYVTGHGSFRTLGWRGVDALVLGAIINTATYVAFVRKRRYLKIALEYADESRQRRRLHTFLCGIYA